MLPRLLSAWPRSASLAARAQQLRLLDGPGPAVRGVGMNWWAAFVLQGAGD